MADSDDETKQMRSELHGTGIPVRSVEDAKNGDLPPGLAVVVKPDSDFVVVAFQRKMIGKVTQTTGQSGDEIWQSLDVDTVVSKDLHRVVFEIASLHPPLD